jgi:hypothetical protein
MQFQGFHFLTSPIEKKKKKEPIFGSELQLIKAI